MYLNSVVYCLWLELCVCVCVWARRALSSREQNNRLASLCLQTPLLLDWHLRSANRRTNHNPDFLLVMRSGSQHPAPANHRAYITIKLNGAVLADSVAPRSGGIWKKFLSLARSQQNWAVIMKNAMLLSKLYFFSFTIHVFILMMMDCADLLHYVSHWSAGNWLLCVSLVSSVTCFCFIPSAVIRLILTVIQDCWFITTLGHVDTIIHNFYSHF